MSGQLKDTVATIHLTHSFLIKNKVHTLNLWSQTWVVTRKCKCCQPYSQLQRVYLSAHCWWTAFHLQPEYIYWMDPALQNESTCKNNVNNVVKISEYSDLTVMQKDWNVTTIFMNLHNFVQESKVKNLHKSINCLRIYRHSRLHFVHYEFMILYNILTYLLHGA